VLEKIWDRQTVVTPGHGFIAYIQGGPRKVKPTRPTILLVTFECVGKIQ